MTRSIRSSRLLSARLQSVIVACQADVPQLVITELIESVFCLPALPGPGARDAAPKTSTGLKQAGEPCDYYGPSMPVTPLLAEY